MPDIVYHKKLEEAIGRNNYILLRTLKENYLGDCIDVLLSLSKEGDKNLIVVNFGSQNILEKFRNAGGDSNKCHVVSNSDGDFQEVEVSVYTLFEELGVENSVVVFLFLHEWVDRKDANEVGIFLGEFKERVRV